MSSARTNVAVPAERIRDAIFVVREQKVILDADLALLYGVPTKRFNEAVKRNLAKFPSDFMFVLTAEEWDALRSQFATSNVQRGGRRYLPYVFTEHGALMASMILSSPRAIEMSIYVVRAFVQLRETLASQAELARQLRALEIRMLKKFATHDTAISDILATLKQLMSPPPSSKRRIGFVIDDPAPSKSPVGSRAIGKTPRSKVTPTAS